MITLFFGGYSFKQKTQPNQVHPSRINNTHLDVVEDSDDDEEGYFSCFSDGELVFNSETEHEGFFDASSFTAEETQIGGQQPSKNDSQRVDNKNVQNSIKKETVLGNTKNQLVDDEDEGNDADDEGWTLVQRRQKPKKAKRTNEEGQTRQRRSNNNNRRRRT